MTQAAPKPVPWCSPEHRYRNDADFRMLVDLMEHWVHRAQYTPSEIRQAAILASIHHETHTLRSFTIPCDEETIQAILASKRRLDDLLVDLGPKPLGRGR